MPAATEDLRGRLLAECANHIWALRPDAIATVRNCAAGAMSAAEARRKLGLETVGEDDEPQPEQPVALIRLHGLITPKGSFLDMLFGVGGGGLQGFLASLQHAVDDPSIESILIDVDSPGGYHTLVPEAAAAVLAARAAKPIVAIANTMAASAAYYIAAQADELVMTPSGVVGSIGVYSTHEDWSKFEERFGVKTTLISAGTFKTEGNEFEPLSADARAHMQAEVDALYEEFLTDVAGGRGTTVEDVRANFGQGRCLRASQALEAGLVDRVETFEDLVGRLVAGDVTRRSAPAAAAPAAAAPPALAPAVLAGAATRSARLRPPPTRCRWSTCTARRSARGPSGPRTSTHSISPARSATRSRAARWRRCSPTAR